MPSLASDLRKTLEATVVKARDKAESGARDALTALAVDASEPFGSMSEEERKLRNHLRARGRQLGDQRNPQKGTQSIERLVREMAYEHWHRMLFARFLAENQLLIEPSSGVSISLDECEELAAEEGTDLWGLAAQFAQAMLPQIFRLDDPVLAAKLPLEIRQQLQGLVAGLATETFSASDSLGWTYQFWQTKRKKEVNDSGVKIGADEISPVTQLFTEDYMVDFLLDNTLGAWHAGKVLAANPELASTAQTEDDLRQTVALPDCPWSYLRFIKSDDGLWAPAAGTFKGWPRTAAELKCLDPCMGSGHFVVAMFERLVALRLAEGDQMEAAAVAAVIEFNLFGLEIDPRCTQIAAFNLALAAWRRVGHCKLPALNLACSGLAPNTSEAEWLALAGDSDRLRNGMGRLYRLFQKASVLGSLINPRAGESNLLVAGFHELQPLLEHALVQESKDDFAHELAVTARGLAKAADVLACEFTLVATNVPFLGRKNQDVALASFCAETYAEEKLDLATCLLARCLTLSAQSGSVSLVMPQNPLFLASYKGFRRRLLSSCEWNVVARLGEHGFESSAAAGGFTALVTLTARQPKASQTCACTVDVAAQRGEQAIYAEAKSIFLKEKNLVAFRQTDLLRTPDAAVVFGEASEGPLLSLYADSLQGAHTFDISRFRLKFWELPSCLDLWNLHSSSPTGSAHYSGCHYVSYKRDENNALGLVIKEIESDPRETRSVAWRAGHRAWGKKGVACAWMGTLPVSLYIGQVFDNSAAVILPTDEDTLLPIYCFCSSPQFLKEVRKINQKTQVANTTLVKVPFDLTHWQKMAAEKYPHGLPKPFSSDATQWLFNGHPAGADQPLHVAVARLVGYEWPRQTGSSFPDCPALGPDGLEALSDEDGIVCLAPARGEASAVERLRKILATALGDEWSLAKERELLLATALDNNANRPEPDLESWLRSCFFSEHCKLFDSRPLIWQIWDGNPHGFSALVNYHKLAAPKGQGRKTLELLTYTYLGDWIDRQKLDQAEGVNGADDRLAAALDLQGQLIKILEGEPPYDLFVRWKGLHQQGISWDPDINDGVRLNIRPFLSAQLRKGGKTGAGILRAKPGTIKWSKDRGNEPMRSKAEFPWFWGWDENSPAMATDFGAPVPGAPPAGDSFDGNRWNDLHYSRAAKEAARARHRVEA
jgi:hypothetical protein